MYLKEISLLNYKNIAETQLEFSPKVNCIVGSNGEGKTNLIDAIYYLSFCRSAINPNDSQVIRHDCDFMMLQGKYLPFGHGDSETIYCGLKKQQKKVFKRNGKEYQRLSEHIGHIRLVMVSPQDTDLILGGSEIRRKFMDMVISQYQVEYLHQEIRYRKALQQRNALLRALTEPDEAFISIYEEEMAQAGEYVSNQRRTFLQEFLPIFSQIYQQLAGKDEGADLKYVSQTDRGSLLTQIQESRPKDRIMGFSLCGTHRDDLNMLLHDFPIKREGSQGQNKTFVIALKLAQFVFLKNKGKSHLPILLFDDIFDKLDTQRVEQIVKMVGEDDFGQIFITHTNKDFLKGVLKENTDYIVHVNNGVITRSI